MTTAMPGDHIVIGNDVAELRRMTGWLRAYTKAVDMPPQLVHRLDVCANEAVANIISYAYDQPGWHEITLALSETARGVRLVIRDDGKPFNVLEVPEHVAPANLDDARIGGFGVHIIRRLMAHCDYRRENDINVLSLETAHKLQPGNA